MTAWYLGSSSLCTTGSRKRALHLINALVRGWSPYISSAREIQYFPYFLHWHHECSRLFFVGERCRVHSNAKQVVIVHTSSSGHYYGPDRWASGPTTWPGAPWNAMKFRSQNKASFTAILQNTFPPVLSVPLFFLFTSPSGNAITASRPSVETIYHRLCRCKPGRILGFLRQESVHIQKHKLLPRIPQYYPDWEYRRSTVSHYIATLIFFISIILWT